MPGPFQHQAVGLFCLMVSLPPRQREALTLAACGYTDVEVAQRMVISHHTASWYLRLARQRLNASNTAHAVALAWFFKLIDLETFLAETAIDEG